MLIFRKMLGVLLILAVFSGAALAQVRVYAAASLSDILQQVGARFTQETGIEIVIVGAGSSTLAQQIVAGAPADIFISAHFDWISFVQTGAEFGPEKALLANELIVVSHQSSELALNNLGDLSGVLGTHRLALGDPDHVPAGIYAKQALENFGVWGDVKNLLAPTANVRAALRLVTSGAAPLGIVYKSDAEDKTVRIVLEIEKNLHAEIIYWGALNENASSESVQFFEYLQGEILAEIALDLGFSLIGGS